MAKDKIDRAGLADKLVESATSAEDPLRAMAEMTANSVMEAEVTAKVGAGPHERRAERTTHRNGFRDRRWDTPLGKLSLKVPTLREGGYVPSFIEHRKRSEQALVSVISLTSRIVNSSANVMNGLVSPVGSRPHPLRRKRLVEELVRS